MCVYVEEYGGVFDDEQPPRQASSRRSKQSLFPTINNNSILIKFECFHIIK